MGAESTVEKYSEDNLPTYTPMSWSLNEIKAAIPPELFIRSTKRGLLCLARDILFIATAWSLATTIDPLFKQSAMRETLTPIGAETARWTAWGVYWWLQGLIFTGTWVIGHDCGHEAYSDHKIVNDVVGFVTHTLLVTPYFSWKYLHRRHHFNNALMQRDDVFPAKTRQELGIPTKPMDKIDWDELFGDTPIYMLYVLVKQHLLAFPSSFLYGVSLDPNASMFTKAQRGGVIMSDIGIAAMVWGIFRASTIWGASEVIKYYIIPWLCVTHWFLMITFLHHTDPKMPRYRSKEWTFQRGAAATVDRDFMGGVGRFLLHGVARYHVVHHFFPKMPFYHGPEATQHLKAFIGEHYAFSDKPTYKALWESYNFCQFVEDEGDVLFYRNKKGEAVRRPSEEYRVESKSE